MLTSGPKVCARRWAALVAALLLVPLAGALGTQSSAAANGACLSGSGTSLDPFLVATAADLAKVGSGTNGCGADKDYLQTADITLTAPTAGSGNHTPIASFSGTYDGGGHTIAGVVIVAASNFVGFFGSTLDAIIRRIHLVESSVTVTGSSNDDHGGLIGYANETIVTDSSFSGTVTSAGDYVGGLIGYGPRAFVLRSSSEGTVTGVSNVGGLVGYLPSGGVNASFSTATVNASHNTDDSAGGLIGYFPSGDGSRLHVVGSTTATTTVGTSIVTGDTFAFVFTLDLSENFTSGSDTSQTFNNAVKRFRFDASPGNTGTWAPDGITWAINPVKNLVSDSNSAQITLQVTGSGAPAIDSVAFLDLDITLDWELTDLAVRGRGDEANYTLEDFLGTRRPPLDKATVDVKLRDNGQKSAMFVSTLETGFPQDGVLTDSYARGDVRVTNGGKWVGGLSGYVPFTRIDRVYSTGAVTVTGTETNVGGLVGQAASDVFLNSFWDTETSGRSSSDAGTGRTTAQLTFLTTFTDTATTGLTTAWPIVDGWAPYVAATRVWGICSDVNDGYPFLLWQFTSNPCSVSAAAAPAAPTLDVTCSDAGPAGTLAIGTPITCTVTGGDPDIDILWRAAYNPTFAEGVVRTGADGTGTLVLTVPAAATGSPVTVELVAWTAPILVGTAGGPIPTAVNAGGGSTANVWPLVLGASMLVAAATAANPVARRRRRTANA
jgi:hypothetical protein